MIPAGLIIASAALWVAALTLAPLVLAHVDPGRVLYTASALLYAATSWICHQRPERSFHLDGLQLPVCARCFGAYVGAAVGVAAPWWRLPSASPTWRRALLATGAVVALTYLIEWGGVPPGNAVRAVTAIPFGAVVGALILAVSQRRVR